jgi:isoleucyl-tRNA synthetase
MFRIAESFARWIAPVLSFTADEMWQQLPGERAGNVLFCTWYEGLAPLADHASSGQAALSATDMDGLLALREQVAKVLEPMRAAGGIGAALDAEIELRCGVAEQNRLAPLADELRFLFISGDVRVVPDAEARGMVGVFAQPTTKAKCVRCWHRRADVGIDPRHPELCGRCVSNIEGPGEDRQWF